MIYKKKTRINKLWLPLFVFSVFLGLAVLSPGLLSSETDGETLQPAKILYYIIFVGLWLSAATLLNVVLRIFFWDRIIARSMKDRVPQLLIDVFSVLIYIIAITIIIGGVFKQPLTGFWATSGVVALIIGLALRNMILDFFTGLAINIEQPYKIGDYVTVHQRNPEQDITGQIIEINWRACRIRTEDNNIVIIPNNQMSLFVVTNYWNNELPMRDEAEFCLDFSVSTQRARRVLLAGVKTVAESGEILSEPQPDVLVKTTNDLGVVYRVRYWIQPWRTKSPGRYKDAVNTSILEHLARSGLTLAYPKEDIYYEKLPHRQLDSSSFDDRCELLRKIDLFASLEQKEINLLAENMYEINFKTSDTLIKQGDQGLSMYILMEGLLDVFIENPNGDKPVKVASLLPGQFFGEMSLLTGEPRMATIKASTDGVVYEISKEHLQKLFNNRPAIMQIMSNVMANRKFSNLKKMEESTVIEEDLAENTAQHFMKRITSFFKSSS